jgi:hypothetical protein
MSMNDKDIALEISQFSDGALILSCAKCGMETDLVFSSGAMTDDPLLERQRKILEYIAAKVNRE